MNKLDIASTGFPETTKTWEFTQDILKEGFLALAKLAGENIIISGVEHDTETDTVTDGFIIYNDEIYKFEGGVYNAVVSVIETTEQVPYNTDINDDSVLDVLPAYTTRVAKCGTGLPDTALTFDFADLKTIKSLYELSLFDVPAATEEVAGVAEILTQAEANADIDDSRILTIKKLITRTANTIRASVIKTATSLMVQAGTDATTAITPKALKDAGITPILMTRGTVLTQNRQNGYLQNDYSANYAYVYPHAGYSMTHLVGFIPSIAEIHFAGDVDNNDTLWCKYQIQSNRVAIICQNRENRDNSKVNYLAIWQK